MIRAGALLLVALLMHACADDAAPVRQVHTSFTEASGLVVTDGRGPSQQLIPDSRGVRTLVSPSGRWIAVEDTRLSNLVIVRAFRYSGERYEEVPLPGIRQRWQSIANQAGLQFDDLINPRVGIEGFGPEERSVLLHFRADSGLPDAPELSARAEIALDSPPGG
jgi:hypothetical protein